MATAGEVIIRRKPLSKATVVGLVVGLALLAVAGPVFMAIQVAHSEGLAAERSLVESYANDALRRSVDTANETSAGINQLVALTRGGDRCSGPAIRRMQALGLSSPYVQAFAAMSGDDIMCSSLGGTAADLDIGPANTTTPAGAEIRNHVTFGFDPTHTVYLVLEQHGFAAIVNRELPVDVTTEGTNVALSVFSYPGGAVDASSGKVSQAWLRTALTVVPNHPSRPEAQTRTFSENGYLVSVVTSSQRYVGVVSVISTAHVDNQARRVAIFLIPLGVLAGLLLAAAVLYLARLQLALPAVIRTAMRRREFFVVYQPVVELASGRWIGAEALVRWRRPNGELVRPDLFLPVIEDCGLSQRFTTHLVDLMTPDLAILAERYPEFAISINVTAADLHSIETIELFRHLIEVTGMRPDRLAVEATERGFLDPNAASGVLEGLHALGVSVDIDDFGTGYSSLSYLEALDVDALKIDKSFVDTLGTGAATSHVVFHIIEIAKSLGLTMIAEGVEHEAQAQVLRDRGVERAQGWLYSTPLVFESLLTGLRQGVGIATDSAKQGALS